MSILISGSGIAGLTLAKFLDQERLDYKIFDRRKNLMDATTALQLGSNCRNILQKLCLEEELKLVSRSCNELYVYDRKLKLLNKLNIKNKHNEGSLLIRRNDVMKILNQSIKQEVLLNESTETSKVSDTVIKFDATGIFSSNNFHINTKTIGIRGISKISDEIFNHLNLFCFNFCHLVTYPLTNNEFAFTFITNDEIKNKEWSKELETRDFEKIDSVLPKILSMGLLNAVEIKKWPIFKTKSIKWESNSMLMIGDAAHGFQPHLAQGATQAIIDAYYASKWLLEKETTTYTKFLQSRTNVINKIRLNSQLNRYIYQLPYPLSIGRDLVLKNTNPSYNWLFHGNNEA